jgi:hypothetical protein
MLNEIDLSKLKYKVDYDRFINNNKSNIPLFSHTLPNLIIQQQGAISNKAIRTWEIYYSKIPNECIGHLEQLLVFCNKNNPAVGTLRGILRITELCNLPIELHDLAINISFSALQNQEYPIAIRCYALGILAKMAKHYPDLKSEILLQIEHIKLYQEVSPAFHGKCRIVVKQLSKIKG